MTETSEETQQPETKKGPDQKTIDRILYISGCCGKPPDEDHAPEDS